MDNSSPKVTINALSHQGKAEIALGNQVIKLEDRTKKTLKTNRVDDFIAYLVAFAKSFADLRWDVYYSQSTCKAVISEPRHDDHEIALCDLSPSRWLKELKLMLGKEVRPKDFEEFLTSFKRSLAPAGLKVLDHVRDFKMQKTTSINSKKDNNGNYNYSVIREGGVDNFQLPEQIVFSVPVFEYHEECVDIPCDIFFDYSDNAGSISMIWKLKCYDFEDLVQREMNEIMKNKLSVLPCPQYWGDAVVTKQTNEWEHKLNELDL